MDVYLSNIESEYMTGSWSGLTNFNENANFWAQIDSKIEFSK